MKTPHAGWVPFQRTWFPMALWFLSATLPFPLWAASGTWSNPAGGSWESTSNWSLGVVASGTDGTANFGTLNLVSDATVSVGSSISIGNLVFGDTTPSNNWIVGSSGGAILTLATSSGVPQITVNNQSATLALPVSSIPGITKSGTGRLILGGTTTGTVSLGGTSVVTSSLNASAGILAVTGTISLTGTTSSAAANFNVANAGNLAITSITGSAILKATNATINIATAGSARGILIIQDSAMLTAEVTHGGAVPQGGTQGHFYVGQNATGYAAVYQSGGTVKVENQLMIGNSGFGFYSLSGSGTILGNGVANATVSGAPARLRIGNSGTGIFYQSGGMVSGSVACQIGHTSAGTGVVYLTGGSFTDAGASALGDGLNSRGELTINGGQLILPAGLTLGGGAGATAILNLVSGTLQTTSVAGSATSGSTLQINFNGGALKASSSTALLSGSLANYTVNLFGGGAGIDTNGFSMTLAQALLAPTGNGVTSIPVTNGGSGYVAPPVVTISGATGATAIANLADDGTGLGTYKVASITVTNPGQNALSPTATLSGGGATSAATLGTPVTAANNSGGLTKSGSGTLTLAGTNTFTGPITITGGVLKAGGTTSVLGINPALSLANATGVALDLNGYDATLSSISGGGDLGGDVILGTSSLFLVSNTSSTSYAGCISGSGTLSMTGSGTQIFSGTNTFSGTTFIDGCMLQLGDGISRNGIIAGNIVNNGWLVFANPADQAFGGIISGSGSGSAVGSVGGLVKTGSGTLILTGSNSFSGDVTITGGTLQLGNGSLNGSLAGNIINNSALIFYGATAQSYAGIISGTGTLTITGTGTLTLTGSSTLVGTTTINAGASLQLGSGTNSGVLPGNIVNNGSLLVNNAGNESLPGMLSGTGALVKTGSGQLTLGGCSLTGTVTLGGGTLMIPSNPAGVVPRLAVSANSTLMVASSFGFTNLQSITINSGATLTINTNGYDITLPANISGAGMLAKTGKGTLTLTGSNSYSGSTTANGGRLALQGISNLGGPIVLTSGSLLFSGSISNPGGVTVNGGILQINAGSLPVSGTITINGSGALAATGAYETVTGWLASGRISSNSTGTIALTISGTSVEAINMNQGGNIYANLLLGATGTCTYTGVLTPVNGVYRMGGAGGTLIYSPAITGTSSVAIGAQGGYGTVVLSASNTFSGGSRVTGGTLKAGQQNALGSGTITLAGGGGSGNTTALDANNTTITNPIVQTARTTVMNTGGGIGTVTGTINAGIDYFYVTAAPGSTLLLSGNIVSTTSVGSGFTGGGGGQPHGGLVILAPTSGTNLFTALELMGGGTVRANDGAGLPSNAGLILYDGIFETGTNLLRPLGSGSNGVRFTGGKTGFGAYGAPVTVNLGNASTLLWSGTESNGLNITGLILNGTTSNNKLTLANPIDLNGEAKDSRGTLSSAHSITVYSGTAQLSGNLSNSGTTAAAILKNGSGTLILSGTNSYDGGTSVAEGTLQFNSALAIAGTGANVKVSAGATVSAGYAIDNAFLSRIDHSLLTGFTIALAANSSNNLDLSGTTGANLNNVSLGATGSFSYNGTLKPYGTSYCLGGGGGTLTMVNSLTGSNSLVINNHSSGGTVAIPASNSYTGGTLILDGTLQAGTGIVPAAPTYLTAKLASSSSAVLNWLDHASNETGFIVESSTDNNSFSLLANLGAETTSYTASGLAANRTWYFRVRALNNTTASSNSNVASVSTQTPVLNAPTLDSATADYLWVDLAWTNNATNHTGFVLQSSTNNLNFSEIARVPTGVPLQYSAYVGTSQTTYFRVAACDVDGNLGTWSNVLSASTDATKNLSADLLHRFQLDDGSRTYNANNPAFPASTQFTDAQKQTQRDNMAAMVTALQAAVSNTNTSSYTIAANDYRLSGTGISISNRSNFTINTSGTANFWYEGTTGGSVFVLTSCTNFTVRGPMVLDAENLGYTQGVISTYDPVGATLDLQIPAGYSTSLPPASIACLLFDTAGWELGEFTFTGSQSTGERSVRLSGVSLGGRPLPMQAGYIVAFEGGANFPDYKIANGSNANNRNLTYSDMTIYCGTGAPVDTNAAAGTTSWINYRCIPRPGTNRVYTNWPGQFARNGGTLLFDGCEFTTAGDDGINLMSSMGLVVGQTGPRTLIVNRFTPAVGDTLTFYQYIGYQLEGTATVTAVSSLTDAGVTAAATAWFTTHGSRWPGSATSYLLTLDQDVNISAYSQFYDSSFGADSLIVRNTRWRNMYAQGVLAQGAKQVVVKNCLFQGNFGNAAAAQSSQYWQEGKWPKNILFRNNISQQDGQWGMAALAVYPGLAYSSTQRLIENVTIDGNMIFDPGTCGISVANANNVLIARNYISNPGFVSRVANDSGANVVAGIFVDAVSNLVLANNSFAFGGSGITQAIYLGANADLSTTVSTNNLILTGSQPAPTLASLFLAWQTKYAVNSGAAGDPSGTGIPNLLAYGLGLNPNAPERSLLPSRSLQVNPADGLTYLVFNFRRLISSAGLVYEVQTSPDLLNWSSDGTSYEQVGSPVANSDGISETVTIRLLPSVQAQGTARKFIRLKVSAP